jgi:pilus assembly protein CpaE
MARQALVVPEAVGEVELVDEVLQRFGFAPAVEVSSLDAALVRLHQQHFDLLVVPVGGSSAVDLAALEREIRQRERTFVIGTGPRPDAALILQAMRAGVHEFLVSPPDPTELAAAVDRLVRRGEQETAQGQTIAVYSAKGGVGTTTLAINLAFAIARHAARKRVALVDFAVAGGDVRVLLNLKAAYDIGDLMARMQRVDADLLTSILTPLEGGVWVLPSAERPVVAELVDAAAATAVLDQLRRNFGYTVVDCEHHLTERTLAALDLADRILLVTQLNVAALRSTQRTIELAQRLGYPEDKLLVVVNRHEAKDVLTLSDAADLLGQPVYFHLPNDYRVSAAAQAKGVPVLLHEPSSKLSESLLALAAKMAGGATPSRNGNRSGAPSSRFGRLLGFGRK